MNILITAGGTTEKIDEVRGITNTGTGRLGALVAATFAADPAVRRIFYLCSAKAKQPVHEKVTVRIADDTDALEQAVRTICGENRIDAVIHSMAVSDYRTGTVTSSAALTERILATLKPGSSPDEKEIRDAVLNEKDIRDVILNEKAMRDAILSSPNLAAEGKIGSGHEDLVVVLTPTPKIIRLLRGLCPDAILVGFKLLTGVSEQTLIDAAGRLLEKNDCDFVLANDLDEIDEAGHTGHLVDRMKHYETWRSKEEIAVGIVQAVSSQWKAKTEGGAS